VLVLSYCIFLVKQTYYPVSRQNAYDDIIREASRRHQVSPFLVKAVIRKESDFNPLAVGAVGEIGLMQITDGAVEDWERHTGRECRLSALRFDPRMNIEIGTWYLGKAVRRWRGWKNGIFLALAQYNAGPSKAKAWAPEDPREKVPLDAIEFPGTREYIERVLEYLHEFEREFDQREKK
jgi:soluble lytic murein transglycosylase